MGDEPVPQARRWPLAARIMIGVAVGAIAGLAARAAGADAATLGAPGPGDADGNGLRDWLDTALAVAEPIGKVFLRLIFMVVLPLVFSALVLGVYGIGDTRRLGWMGLRTLLISLALSTAAVVVGVGLVNLIRPGAGISEEQRQALRAQFRAGADKAVEQAAKAKTTSQALLDLIPENPLQEAVGALDGSSKGGGMLALMVFAVAFGSAMLQAPAERIQPLAAVLEGLFDVGMVVIGFAMRLAPYCVGCLLFAATARIGWDILLTLSWFVATVMLGLTLHFVVVYGLALRLLADVSLLAFVRQTSEALLTAFATSSSNATLPTALRVARERLLLPPTVANFVLTVGATGNQNGTALYEGVVVLFLAQLFGVDLSLGQQFTVAVVCVLAGIGTAGVPGGSLPLIIVVLQSVGVEGGSIAIILGIDRILDMSRTVLNVGGDLVVATCVARWEPADAKPAA